MATIFRAPLVTGYLPRKVLQPDPVPNLLLSTLRGVILGTAPFHQQDWPTPVRARTYTQDFTWSGFATRNIPTIPPFRQSEWPTPVRARATPADQVQSGYPAVTTQPFAPIDWPLPMTRIGSADYHQFETVTYLPQPPAPPFIPIDFPTPMRARAFPQDFTFNTTSIPPPAPFRQTDWPVFVRVRSPHQDHIWLGTTTLGIPIPPPLRPLEWTTPIRARWTPPDLTFQGFTTRGLPPPTPAPLFQTDWPLPRSTPRITPPDWAWPGTLTRGIPPPAFPSGPFPSVRLEVYDVQIGTALLRWSASPSAFAYRIYINGIPQPTTVSTRAATVSGLVIDTAYAFNIVAVNHDGTDSSILSNTIVYEHGSNEIEDVFRYPWGNTPQTGYVIKEHLDV